MPNGFLQFMTFSSASAEDTCWSGSVGTIASYIIIQLPLKISHTYAQGVG